MNEKISRELFSSLISKINQIPNYSTPCKKTPTTKDNQKLTQLYHLYNIDSLQREIFLNIFKNVYDYNLRKNLVKIMIHIGTKFNSFSVSDTNSIFNKEASNELLALFSESWNYFSLKSEYLKDIEIEEFQYASDEYIEYDKTFIETVCFACGLINIIIFMFKKQFSILDNFNKKQVISNVNKITSNLNKELIQTEINILFIINKNRIWLDPLITLLEQILKFILSNSNFYRLFNMKLEKYRKKEREGLITKEEIIQNINAYINYLIDDDNVLKIICTLVVKYNALNNLNILTDSIIQIKDLNNMIQRFFNVYIVFLMNQNYLGEYSTEEQIYSLGINIIECIMNSKYKDQNYGIDFVCFFYSAEKFMEEIFDEINVKLINEINEINAFLKVGCINIKMPNLNLLQKLENSLKDYLLFTFVSSYNKDSFCDLYLNYSKHKKIFLNFGLIRAYIIICRSILKSLNYYKFQEDNKFDGDNMIEKKKQTIIGNIFDDLLSELNKYYIVLPIRMFLYKNYIIQSILVVFHKFVKLFDKYILNAHSDKFIFYNNLGLIKEMSESVNSLFFLLGNDILKCLKFPYNNNKNNNDINKQISNQSNTSFLRIYFESSIMNYITLIQEKVPNTFKIYANSKKIKQEIPPMNSSILNKFNTPYKRNEKSNLLGNFSLFSQNQKPKNNIIQSGIFNKNFNDNMDIDSDDDNEKNKGINFFSNKNGNKNGYTILPSNIFRSNIIKSEVKKKISIKLNEFIYRYDITNFIDSFKKEELEKLKEIGYEYKNENEKHYIYINQDDVLDSDPCRIIYFNKEKIKMISLRNGNMYNLIKNEPLTKEVNDQLFSNFLDGIDDTNKGKNITITLRYYDIKFHLDYFNFIEKCKKFIL